MATCSQPHKHKKISKSDIVYEGYANTKFKARNKCKESYLTLKKGLPKQPILVVLLTSDKQKQEQSFVVDGVSVKDNDDDIRVDSNGNQIFIHPTTTKEQITWIAVLKSSTTQSVHIPVQHRSLHHDEYSLLHVEEITFSNNNLHHHLIVLHSPYDNNEIRYCWNSLEIKQLRTVEEGVHLEFCPQCSTCNEFAKKGFTLCFLQNEIESCLDFFCEHKVARRKSDEKNVCEMINHSNLCTYSTKSSHYQPHIDNDTRLSTTTHEVSTQSREFKSEQQVETTGLPTNTSLIIEQRVFEKYYEKMCFTITDITELLNYFVQEKIITIDESDLIKKKLDSFKMVEQLLIHISGPLAASGCDNFRIMLRIMMEYGTLATKQLAIDMTEDLNSFKRLAHFNALMNCVAIIYPKWQYIGVSLGLSTDLMNGIASEVKNSDDLNEKDFSVCCCISMLMSWFHKSNEATLDSFIKIIQYPSCDLQSSDIASLKYALINHCNPPLSDSKNPPTPEAHKFTKMLAQVIVELEKNSELIDNATKYYLQLLSPSVSPLVWKNVTEWGTLINKLYHYRYISLVDVDWLEDILDVSDCEKGIKKVKEYKESIEMISLAGNIQWEAYPNSSKNGFVRTTTNRKPHDAKCYHIDLAKKITAKLLNCKVTDLLPHSASVGSVSYNWKVSLEVCINLTLPTTISPALLEACDRIQVTEITIIKGVKRDAVLMSELVLKIDEIIEHPKDDLKSKYSHKIGCKASDSIFKVHHDKTISGKQKLPHIQSTVLVHKKLKEIPKSDIVPVRYGNLKDNVNLIIRPPMPPRTYQRLGFLNAPPAKPYWPPYLPPYSRIKSLARWDNLVCPYMITNKIVINNDGYISAMLGHSGSKTDLQPTRTPPRRDHKLNLREQQQLHQVRKQQKQPPPKKHQLHQCNSTAVPPRNIRRFVPKFPVVPSEDIARRQEPEDLVSSQPQSQTASCIELISNTTSSPTNDERDYHNADQVELLSSLKPPEQSKSILPEASDDSDTGFRDYINLLDVVSPDYMNLPNILPCYISIPDILQSMSTEVQKAKTNPPPVAQRIGQKTISRMVSRQQQSEIPCSQTGRSVNSGISQPALSADQSPRAQVNYSLKSKHSETNPVKGSSPPVSAKTIKPSQEQVNTNQSQYTITTAVDTTSRGGDTATQGQQSFYTTPNTLPNVSTKLLSRLKYPESSSLRRVKSSGSLPLATKRGHSSQQRTQNTTVHESKVVTTAPVSQPSSSQTAGLAKRTTCATSAVKQLASQLNTGLIKPKQSRKLPVRRSSFSNEGSTVPMEPSQKQLPAKLSSSSTSNLELSMTPLIQPATAQVLGHTFTGTSHIAHAVPQLQHTTPSQVPPPVNTQLVTIDKSLSKSSMTTFGVAETIGFDYVEDQGFKPPEEAPTTVEENDGLESRSKFGSTFGNTAPANSMI